MSTLQLSLLIIVIVVVAGVYLYNLFEERQMRRRMDASFAPRDDVLLQPRRELPQERTEPVLGAMEEPPEAVEEKPDSPPPATAEEAPPRPSRPAETAREEVEAPDPHIESVVMLENLRIPAEGWERFATANLGKPIRWLGRRGNAWQLAHAGESYEEGAACLLLANRAGAVTRQQLEGFHALVKDGEGRYWKTEPGSGREAEIARAVDLDRRCADLDIQVGLNLMRNNRAPLAGTRLRGVAEASGFHLDDAGQFDYLHEETGKLQFVLINGDSQPFSAEGLKTLQTQAVTLLLDVPRVADPVKAFDQMRIVAKRIAPTLESSLQDDNRQALSDASFLAIRGRIQQTAAALRGMQVEPGGARALRLFS
jgi:hypothetical protein